MSEINICPECESIQLYQRRPSIQGRELDHKYRCENCTHTFNDPDTREGELGKKGSERSSKLVRQLIDADPSEVGL